jgi:hypothetical protein
MHVNFFEEIKSVVNFVVTYTPLQRISCKTSNNMQLFHYHDDYKPRPLQTSHAFNEQDTPNTDKPRPQPLPNFDLK